MPFSLRLSAAITVTVLLWGSAFVGIRAALPALGYANLASGRLLLAALAFAALSRRFPVPRPSRAQLPLLATLGATGYAGYQLLLSAAEQTVPAGTSALLFSAAPVLASALAGPLLGDRVSRRGWIGLGIAVAGVAISEGGLSGPLTGGALVLAAVWLYALWVVLQKRALRGMSAFAITAWATWFGAAIALPFASGLPHAAVSAPTGALITLLLLGTVITTVPFLLWTWTMSRLDATVAAPLLLLIAPVTLLIAWLWLDETPTALALTGGAVTLTGVTVAQLRRPPVGPRVAWMRQPQLDLDLQQLDVSAVRVNGNPAAFSRDGQELQITPTNRLQEGSTFNVAVDYGGVPQTIVGSPIVFGSPYGFLHTPDGMFVGSEPNAQSTWMPQSDHPADKATWTFHATVPEGKGVVSNGRLVSQETQGGKTTFTWDEPLPMATYLATVDVGYWVIRTGSTPAGTPQTVAVDPVLQDAAPGAMDRYWNTSADVTDLWSETFGPYPFDSTGAIADDARFNGQPLGFSLETQTRPVYSGFRSETTIAHELAHQWFGDSVSPATWPNIWLNEGFVSFAEYVWLEHRGTRTARRSFEIDYSRAATSSFWQVVVADPQRDTMFATAVYRRGAMTLQALREKIGDEKFFAILRTWVAEHRHGHGTTAQFTALAEQISGEDLDHFFDVWIYQTGKPTSW